MHDVKVRQKVYIVAPSSKRPGRNRDGLASQTKPYRIAARNTRWRLLTYSFSSFSSWEVSGTAGITYECYAGQLEDTS